MSRHQEDGRHTQDGGSNLQDRLKKMISSAVRSWGATLRLCFIVSVVAATSMIAYWAERVPRGAIRSWSMILRLCLIFSVVVATLMIVVVVFAPRVHEIADTLR
jgi:hypothetical protein